MWPFLAPTRQVSTCSLSELSTRGFTSSGGKRQYFEKTPQTRRPCRLVQFLRPCRGLPRLQIDSVLVRPPARPRAHHASRADFPYSGLCYDPNHATCWADAVLERLVIAAVWSAHAAHGHTASTHISDCSIFAARGVHLSADAAFCSTFFSYACSRFAMYFLYYSPHNRDGAGSPVD